MREMKIASRRIAPDEPVYVIAEMSASHNQHIDRAKELVEVAADCGADAIKVQCFTPDTMTIACDRPEFVIDSGPWEGWNLYDLYRRACMPWEWIPELQRLAAELGIHFFSTAYDRSAVAYLETLDVPAYKVASFEANDPELLAAIAQTGKPVIVSTGLIVYETILAALEALEPVQTALLYCVSSYPADASQFSLEEIEHMGFHYDVPVGLSDHTKGIAVPVAAAAREACIIEKHIMLDDTETLDSAFSLLPHEFKTMVNSVRTVEKCLRHGEAKQPDGAKFARSLFAVRNITAGQFFTFGNVRSIRPADGLSPKYLPNIVGRRAVVGIERGTPISWDLVEGGASCM